MNLSTSSFKEYIWVLIVVGVAIASLEAFTRTIVLPNSDSYQAIADTYRSGDSLSGDQDSFVVVGNSFTLRAIDEAELTSNLGMANPNMSVSVHAMSGSHICEWFWLMEHCYLKHDTQPDYLMLNVGPYTLFDRKEVRHRRLAMIFGPNNFPLFPASDLNAKKKNLEFLLSRYFMSLNRGRNMGEQIAIRLIPQFKTSKSRLATRLQTDSLTVADSYTNKDTESTKQIEILARLCAACNSKKIKPVVVLMPHKQNYLLPKMLQEFLSSNGIPIVDLQRFDGLSDHHFKDGVHLNESGKKVFTPEYARILLDVLGSSKSF